MRNLLVVLSMTMLVSFYASNVWCLTLWDIGGASRAVHQRHALNPTCLIWWVHSGLLFKDPVLQSILAFHQTLSKGGRTVG